MSRIDVHTNIALDYPAYSGYIYTSDNVVNLFNNIKFKYKLKNNSICGTFGNINIDILDDQISHIVKDAYISEDYEIMFEVETLDTYLGKCLDSAVKNNELLLAKIIARLSNKVINGKVVLYDVKYVHIIISNEW